MIPIPPLLPLLKSLGSRIVHGFIRLLVKGLASRIVSRIIRKLIRRKTKKLLKEFDKWKESQSTEKP